MAKVGFWLQGATGKLAGSKLQGGPNGTIIADNTKKPKNPKTENQTLQRVLMNTVSQAYSGLRDICCHSFQGLKAGQECMARFQKLNLNYLRERAAAVGEDNLGNYINFVPVGEKGIRPAAFIVSDGKLPAVPATINGEFKAVMALGANTYKSVIDTYDLQRGDQLTFVVIEESTSVEGQYAAKYARVILDPRNADGTEAELSSELISGNAINLPNSKNAGNFGVLEFNGGMVFSMKAGAKVCAVGIIVSRQEDEEWMRSKCQLTVSETAIGEQGMSLSRAIYRSLHTNTVYITGANQYLDNAGVSGGQSANSGAGESEQQEQSTPSFNNSVAFTANGSTFNNSVAGGSVAVNAPLTKVVVSGDNLEAANLEVHLSGQLTVTGTVAKVGNNLEWTPQGGSAAAGSSFTFYKKVNGQSTAWFEVTVNDNPGGDGDPDNNGGYNND